MREYCRKKAFGLLMAAIGTIAASAAETGLKDFFPFRLGVAVNQEQSGEKRPIEAALIARHFNQVVAENCMKPEALQPREGEFRFDEADCFVDWAKANGMRVTGHVLVWHEQLPDWFLKGRDGGPCTREILLSRMESHIKTVVGHFKGRVDGWDVVNEAVESDGSWRKTGFLEIIGPEFIDEAFRIAHEADPGAELWYNDYGNESRRKNETIAGIVRRLKAKGIRIDGVGMQTHVRIDKPDISTYEDAISLFSAEGVKVAITEMDVSVLPAAWNLTADISTSVEYRAKYDPWPDGNLDAEVDKRLGERYAEWFAMFRRHAAVIDRVTAWGLSDGESWLNDFPVKGRTDYPLLFDRNLKLKPWARELCRPGAKM